MLRGCAVSRPVGVDSIETLCGVSCNTKVTGPWVFIEIRSAFVCINRRRATTLDRTARGTSTTHNPTRSDVTRQRHTVCDTVNRTGTLSRVMSHGARRGIRSHHARIASRDRVSAGAGSSPLCKKYVQPTCTSTCDCEHHRPSKPAEKSNGDHSHLFSYLREVFGEHAESLASIARYIAPQLAIWRADSPSDCPF